MLAPILVGEDLINGCYWPVSQFRHHTKVAVDEHVAEFVAVVGRRIKFVEAQLVLIVNGYAAAEEPAAFEVLVVVVVVIQLILHQVKMDLLMSYLGNFLCYDMMVT